MNSPAPRSHSPPSNVTTSPRSQSDASETRNAASSASSSCVPKRPAGMRRFLAFSSSAVGRRRRERALGRDRSRRDRVQADAVARPLDRERARQRDDAGLRARAREDEAGAGRGVRRRDREHGAAALLVDPEPARRSRAVEGAVQNDRDDRGEAVRCQILGGTEEVSGGVVDEDVRDAHRLLHARQRGIDLTGVPHVARRGRGAAAGGDDLGDDAIERLEAAPRHGDRRAQSGKANGHRAAQAGAASCDPGGLAAKNVGDERRAERGHFAGCPGGVESPPAAAGKKRASQAATVVQPKITRPKTKPDNR